MYTDQLRATIRYNMYFLIYFTLLLYSTYVNGNSTDENDIDHKIHNMTVSEIGETLLTIIRADKEKDRIKNLEEKLKKVNNFVVDSNQIEELLKNVSRKTDLNQTNFYQALTENDHFRFLTVNDSKNLYLKLKEKMNRDDVMKILSERGGDSVISKSARKVMGKDYLELDDVEPLNDVVDKFIAEQPNDHHKYELTSNDSIYWDPQSELEELHEYHKHDGRRIFKGERTTVRYYPFMVSIHIMARFWCGGSLYWHDLVLTSASCLQLMHNNRFFRENPQVLKIRVGSNHSRIGGETVEALEVYFHPGYNPKTLKNNIAVIRLRRHLYFNYHRVPKLIEISHNENTIAPTGEVLLLGWGVTKMSQKLQYEPIYLQRKVLPVYPNHFCKEVYGEKFITKTMFCAGTFTTGEGACDHDAGGPAILGGKLVGIISFGPAICGFPNTPTVFTLVGAFADWIETINETIPSYYRGRKRSTTSTASPLKGIMATWKGTHETIPTTLMPPVDMSHTPYTTTTVTAEPEAEEETEATEVTDVPAQETPTPPSLRQLKEDSDGGWSIDLK